MNNERRATTYRSIIRFASNALLICWLASLWTRIQVLNIMNAPRDHSLLRLSAQGMQRLIDTEQTKNKLQK